MSIKPMLTKFWVIIALLLISPVSTVSCDDPYINETIEARLPIPNVQWSSPVAQLYRDKIKYLSSLGPWISPHDCDGLLWNGLAASMVERIDLSLAMYAPGELHRRPEPACWSEEFGDRGSRSTISNDMIVGWVIGKHARGLDEEIFDYYERARKAHWIIGKPISQVGRVILKSNLQGVMGLIGRVKNPAPIVFFPVKADYERHLQALLIDLVSDIRGGYTENMTDMLEGLRETDPLDPLFFAASNMKEEAAGKLLSGYIPSYVRGSKHYPHIYQAYVARLILK